jgi:N-acetylmuramoyl-L-alanine amidase CwlA
VEIQIEKHTSTVNTTYAKGRAIEYIVLHYTAGTQSKSGAAANTAAYFGGGNAGGSADFIVDDATIVQYNGDIKNRYCWAVGGSKYTNPTTAQGGTFYNKCTNKNSISVEMCSRKSNTSTLNSTDSDWYLTDATVDNAVKLVKHLMSEYSVPIERVIMHHHVTGKVCPNPWCLNSSRLTAWSNFKNRLEEVDDMTEAQVRTIAKAVVNENAEKVYNSLSEVPDWGKATVEKLINKGALQGTDNGLNLNYTLLRLFVVNDRIGLYD